MYITRNHLLWLCLGIVVVDAYAHISQQSTYQEWLTGRRHLVVVTATYNAKEWCTKYLDSVVAQTYSDYRIIITDDASTDDTADLMQQYITENNLSDKVTLICNKVRQGAMLNQYHMIHNYCSPTDIVVIVDGDDWLIDDTVLTYVACVYANPTIWLTYGQFVEYPTGDYGFCCQMPRHIVERNAFRTYLHIPSHLRTFYAGLFHKISYTDLCEKDGRPFRMCADIAAMFPMIEMASEGHFMFIAQPLLVYNAKNSINDYKVSKSLQRSLDLDIRGRRRYNPLVTLF